MKKLLLPMVLGLALNSASAQTTTLTIRSNPSNSSFRYINNSPAEISSNTWGPSMVIADWTSSSSFYVWRSLLKFNLSGIPAGSVIDSAFLSLYANPTSPSGNPGSPTWGTDNAVGIYRCTAPWDTTTVSWLTQPATTTANGDTLAQSTSWIQDYLNINVTNLIRDCYSAGNYGFLLRHLQETTYYNSMIFYSPFEYSADSNKVPRLVVKYRSTEAVSAVNQQKASLDVYPNPAHGTVNIEVNATHADELSLTISDMLGRTVFTKQVGSSSLQNISVNVNDYAQGCYIIALRNSSGVMETRKLMVD